MLDFNKRPSMAERINALVDAALIAEREATPPRDYLGASRLGHACERALQFEFAGAPKDEGQDFSGRSLRIFAIGHELEDLAIRWLRAAGLDLVTQKRDGGQFGFSVAGGRIRGHVDGIVAEVPAALGLRTPALWECKTMNAKNWRETVSKGVTVAKPVYAAQIALYQAYMEATVPGISAAPALFTAINKDTAGVAPRARALRCRSRAAHVGPGRPDPTGYARQAALGDPLVPYAERVDRAIGTVGVRHRHDDVQRKWLDQIGRELKGRVVLDRAALDEPPFSPRGGVRRLDRDLNGEAEQILRQIAKYAALLTWEELVRWQVADRPPVRDPRGCTRRPLATMRPRWAEH
jgi:hypothetical protein